MSGSITDHLIDKISEYEKEGIELRHIEMPRSLFNKLCEEMGPLTRPIEDNHTGYAGTFMGVGIYIEE